MSTTSSTPATILHVYPDEPFNHDLDQQGSCACGPWVEWAEDPLGRRFWYYRHPALFTADNPPVEFEFTAAGPVPRFVPTPA